MSIEDQIRLQTAREPAQLESEIVRQRDHISELVQALEQKLSPGEMFSRVWTHGKGGGREFASQLGTTVKANPVPALLTAAGLAWLYARSDSTTSATGVTAGDSDSPALGERVHHAREVTAAKLGSAKARASTGFQHMLDQNPLALGAIGIAAGALLGTLIPETRKEHELMGDASDRIKHKLRPEPESSVASASGSTASSTSVGGGQRPASGVTPPQSSAPSTSQPDSSQSGRNQAPGRRF